MENEIRWISYICSTNYQLPFRHSQIHFSLQFFFHEICGGPLVVEAPGQLPSLPMPKSGPASQDSKRGREEDRKNANGFLCHRASKLGATIHIYCHIRCNLNALMAARSSVWNSLFDICSFLMPRVRNKKFVLLSKPVSNCKLRVG